jgi:hypothetical protein
MNKLVYFLISCILVLTASVIVVSYANVLSPTRTVESIQIMFSTAKAVLYSSNLLAFTGAYLGNILLAIFGYWGLILGGALFIVSFSFRSKTSVYGSITIWFCKWVLVLSSILPICIKSISILLGISIPIPTYIALLETTATRAWGQLVASDHSYVVMCLGGLCIGVILMVIECIFLVKATTKNPKKEITEITAITETVSDVPLPTTILDTVLPSMAPLTTVVAPIESVPVVVAPPKAMAVTEKQVKLTKPIEVEPQNSNQSYQNNQNNSAFTITNSKQSMSIVSHILKQLQIPYTASHDMGVFLQDRLVKVFMDTELSNTAYMQLLSYVSKQLPPFLSIQFYLEATSILFFLSNPMQEVPSINFAMPTEKKMYYGIHYNKQSQWVPAPVDSAMVFAFIHSKHTHAIHNLMYLHTKNFSNWGVSVQQSAHASLANLLAIMEEWHKDQGNLLNHYKVRNWLFLPNPTVLYCSVKANHIAIEDKSIFENILKFCTMHSSSTGIYLQILYDITQPCIYTVQGFTNITNKYFVAYMPELFEVQNQKLHGNLVLGSQAKYYLVQNPNHLMFIDSNHTNTWLYTGFGE